LNLHSIAYGTYTQLQQHYCREAVIYNSTHTWRYAIYMNMLCTWLALYIDTVTEITYTLLVAVYLLYMVANY